MASNVTEETGGTIPQPPDDSEGRTIYINSIQREKFKSNQISTAKYSIVTFIPKFLYEQFRRYANIFFLCIGLLQQIPGVSPTGRYVTIVPLFIILCLTAAKEVLEDLKRHQADRRVNNDLVQVLTNTGELIKKKWAEISVGDILKIENFSFFPADLILLSSSEPQGMCHIETANLDGETNLKIRTSLTQTSDYTDGTRLAKLTGQVEAELPNKQLYDFAGRIVPSTEVSQVDGAVEISSEPIPLTADQMLLRGSRLRSPWVFGLVVYTGHESKLLKNSNKTPLKRSTIDIVTNYQIIFLFCILVVLAVTSTIGNYVVSSNGEIHPYLEASVDDYIGFGWTFVTFFILYNNLVPISLQVSLEIVKYVQSLYINWDEEMHYIDEEMGIDSYALARTSNLNEELGQIKYVFSDKTGTLTRNIMEYKKCSVAGVMYDPDRETGDRNEHKDLVENMKSGKNSPEMIKDFLNLLTVCHTVIPEQDEDGKLKYNAASPDEKALVEGAEVYGYKFTTRKPDSVTITTSDDTEETFQVLNVIEFTSTRKRMSIIVRTEEGEIKLFCKGADSVILERLGDQDFQRCHYGTTITHLEEFARSGLRTLCLGVTTITQSEYDQWNKKWKVATAAINNREQLVEEAATKIECNLTLIGATAIEDRLQDQVPETIKNLLEANIHVWMLTGDKQETAINIAKSCLLHKESMQLMIINSSSLEEAKQEIRALLSPLREDKLVGKDNELTLVVDGKSLEFTLQPELKCDFIDLCISCKSVVACRVSPSQKAEIVQLVKDHTKAITLSIGDGANDVAMIQKAAVGVGISGNEGLQAANSADFAIAQFRYLSRLLFVHGAWNYSRISKVILYSFYKNITLYIVELWFAIYNYWSGQVIYERWTIGMYNILFTSLPPIALGLFDRTCTAETREKFPSLYQASQNSELFNIKEFWKWIGISIYHSILLFWLPLGAFHTGVEWSNGRTDDYLVLGNTVYTLVVITTCIKAGIEMDAWTWVSHASIWGSIVLWFLFLAVYSHMWPTFPLASNMPGMFEMMMSSPVFWFCLIFVPTVTLLSDIIYRSIMSTVFRTETDKIRIAEAMNISQSGLSVYTEGGPKPSESSRLLNSMTKKFRKKRHLSGQEPSSTEMDLRRGYAFSQSEGGTVTQSEYIRRYDTTRPRQGNRSAQGGLPPVTRSSPPNSGHRVVSGGLTTRNIQSSAQIHLPGHVV